MLLFFMAMIAVAAAADGASSRDILEELRAIKENQIAQQKQIIDLKIENDFLRSELSQRRTSVQVPARQLEVGWWKTGKNKKKTMKNIKKL